MSRTILALALVSCSMFTLHQTARATDACQPLNDAMFKVTGTPNHVYVSETADYLSGETRNTETILDKDSIYVETNGKWQKTGMTPQNLALQQQAGLKDNKNHFACEYLRDEAVNGESASVYKMHTERVGATFDSEVWISKSSGLPLHAENSKDVGGPAGKSHQQVRWEYGNVAPPSL